MTAREAVAHLRKSARSMKGVDGEAVATLIDHALRLEQTLDLIASATKSAIDHAPDAAVLSGHSW